MTALARLRAARAAWLGAAWLRVLLGFAMLPAGMKKILGEPFTDPALSGPFHDFLDAFYATGFFYRFVGAVQLVIATLLLTQRHAALGALMLAPVITAIGVLCWSTAAYPTAAVVTLMTAGTFGLLVFDPPVRPSAPRPVDLTPWGRAGWALIAFWLVTTALHGGVYRPRGFAPDVPAFWSLPALFLFPALAWWVERRQARGPRP